MARFERDLTRPGVRRSRRTLLLLVLALVALQTAVALTAPRWARLLRRPIAVSGDESGAETPTPTPEDPSRTVQRSINVKLFFEAADRPGLALEERTVPYHSDLATQLRVVLEELIGGSRSGLVAPLPSATRVLEVFVSARGIAFVDLSGEVVAKDSGGSNEELYTVYSLVNTLTMNFPAVKRVQLLVDDRPVDTLGGHVDLLRPLSPDMTLLAPVRLTPLDQQPEAEASPR
jgi:spore germination protein GerM